MQQKKSRQKYEGLGSNLVASVKLMIQIWIINVGRLDNRKNGFSVHIKVLNTYVPMKSSQFLLKIKLKDELEMHGKPCENGK